MLYGVLIVCTELAALFYVRLAEGSPVPHPPLYTHGAFAGLVLGVLVWGFELYFLRSRWGAPIRRAHFLVAIVVKTAILSGAVFVTVLVEQQVLHGGVDEFLALDHPFLRLYRLLGYVLLIVVVFSAIVQVVRIIGARVLGNFILGRYHRPVREGRIFMFLDLAGSTALAERLGDIGVQTMITRFFFDITEPILEWGGEIHRYIGDEVVVTWPLRDGAANAQSVHCYFAIRDRMRLLAAAYARDFGAAPEFRVGLHGGPVVVSECGDAKQEIVYFGDTVNTAARIEQECKRLDRPFLVSGPLLERMSLPPEYAAESMGAIRLRGRGEDIELFAVECPGAPPLTPDSAPAGGS